MPNQSGVGGGSKHHLLTLSSITLIRWFYFELPDLTLAETERSLTRRGQGVIFTVL
jgi:hypothetical protein